MQTDIEMGPHGGIEKKMVSPRKASKGERTAKYPMNNLGYHFFISLRSIIVERERGISEETCYKNDSLDVFLLWRHALSPKPDCTVYLLLLLFPK